MDSVGLSPARVQRMGPRGRLALWIAIVIAALASPAWLLLAERAPIASHAAAEPQRWAATGWAIPTAIVWSWLALTAMWALLATTPANAIMLTRRASAATIVAGAGWLMAFSAGAGISPARPALVAAMGALMLVFATGFLAWQPAARWINKQRGLAPMLPRSMWWFTLVLWHPVFWLAWLPVKGANYASFLALVFAWMSAMGASRRAQRESERPIGSSGSGWTLPAEVLWLASLALLLAGVALQP